MIRILGSGDGAILQHVAPDVFDDDLNKAKRFPLCHPSALAARGLAH